MFDFCDNTLVVYTKSSGALERTRYLFSNRNRGADTMPDHTRAPYFPPNLDDYAPWVTSYGLIAPYGECQCGCGQKTKIATEVNHRQGIKQGEPRRFVRGHQMIKPRHAINEELVRPGTRAIPLTQGKHAIVDEADYEWLMQWQWFGMKRRYGWYAYRKESMPDGTRRIVAMHRAILDVPNQLHVDHRDLDGLNNTRANLRPATPTENVRNRRTPKNNSSGYKGVDFHKASNKWRARINVDSKCIELGFFGSPEEAAAAYNQAATERHGEFARLNNGDD
jgi:hypothetical protein